MTRQERFSLEDYHLQDLFGQTQDAIGPRRHIPLTPFNQKAHIHPGGFLEIKAGKQYPQTDIHLELTADDGVQDISPTPRTLFPPFGGWLMQAWKDEKDILKFYTLKLDPDLDLDNEDVLIHAAQHADPLETLRSSHRLRDLLPVCEITPTNGVRITDRNGNRLFHFASDNTITERISEKGRYYEGGEDEDELYGYEYVTSLALRPFKKDGTMIAQPDTHRVIYGIELGTKNFNELQEFLRTLIDTYDEINYIRTFVNPYIRFEEILQSESEEELDETQGEVG